MIEPIRDHQYLKGEFSRLSIPALAVEVPADGTLTSPLLDGFALPLAPLLGS
ncbi:MAG: hypothetical protein U0R70_17725 [Solirubrobacteraceae bacterium]